MKKFLAFLFIVAMVCLVLCSCGETTPAQTEHVHEFGAWTVTKQATCGEPGEYEKVCSKCGEKETQVISATRIHSFGAWTVTKQATCTEPGEQERVCTNCGEKETWVKAATGHSWEKATCTEPKTCKKCGVTEGEALGHNYVNGQCTRCKAELTWDLVFTFNQFELLVASDVINIPDTIILSGYSGEIEVSNIRLEALKNP
ncbi:MAG: hypothetical protein J5832_02180, partial [Clostridia bacterium]|nr:hypothetical protein [Clostridia bacterium]